MITLTADAAEPPYEQIRTQLRDQITNGELLAGTRLPTVRRLAADLGVAANTVGRAYKELEAAGLVETRRRGGTVVGHGTDELRAHAHADALEFAARMRERGLGLDETVALIRAAFAATTGPHEVTDARPKP